MEIDDTISYLNQNTVLTNSVLDIQRPLKRRKVLLLGGASVGKSALMTRFLEDIFLEFYEPTLQHTQKKVIHFHKESIELEIVDIDGCSEYTIFNFNKFAKGIHGYFLIYNIANKVSFELIKTINSKLNSLVGSGIPRVLVGTQNDTGYREVKYEEGKALSQNIGCPFIEVTAKNDNDNNVKKCFLLLIIEINKKEANFSAEALKCLNIYIWFIRHKKLMKVVYYILMILNCIIGGGILSLCLFFPNVILYNFFYL